MLDGVLAFRVGEAEVEAPAGGAIVEALHDPEGHKDMSTLFREHDSTLIGWP